MHPDARVMIDTLGLIAHPEGGFYRETFRSPLVLRGVPWAGNGERSASTAIYFLLPGGVFSAFHRVLADEAWHHYDGDPADGDTECGYGLTKEAAYADYVAAEPKPSRPTVTDNLGSPYDAPEIREAMYGDANFDEDLEQP